MQEPNLFPYQLVGAKFLASRKYAGLFDGMRMGKTRQFLKGARLIGAETIAVVAKASGVYVWEKEAREWGFNPLVLKAGDKPRWKRFNIFSYNGLIDNGLFEQLTSMCYDLIGGDESDAFKSMDAARTRMFYGYRPDRYNPKKIIFDKEVGLCAYADRVWVMTGTPILNYPNEAYPMMRSLFPDALVNSKGAIMSYHEFCRNFCKYGPDNGFGQKIVGGRNLARLRDLMRGRYLRRTKEEVWEDWKAPVLDTLPVPGNIEGIPSNEIKLVREALEKKDLLNALADIAPHVTTLRRLTGLAKVNGVVDWIDDNIDNCGKIIVFAHHKEVIAALKAKLKHKYVEIIGGMTAEQKCAAYTAFQEDESVKVFIGQNQAARDSIPLWKASTTISVEPDWVPGNNDQMLDRMSHFSKKEPCVGYYATLIGSIDEDIQKANIRKREVTTELGLN